MIKSIVCALAIFSIAHAGPSKELCIITKGCMLSQQLSGCPDVERINPSRCTEARDLDRRGVKINDSIGSKLYDFLGHKHRIVYTVVDTIDVSPARLSFLLNDLPFATKIVNHFKGTPYVFEYVDDDHTQFNLARGENIKGRVNVVSGSTDEQSLYYFGNGTVTVGFLTLNGPAFITLKYDNIPKAYSKSLYAVKVVIVLNNGALSSIMDAGFVRRQVIGKIQGILDDITGAAKMANDKELVMKGPWTPAERRKIEILMMMP